MTGRTPVLRRIGPIVLLGLFAVLAVLIAVAPGWLVPWLTLPTLAVVDTVCLGPLLPRDGAAFASISVPPLVLALVALALQPALAVWLDLIALLWYVPFEFGGGSVWRFWNAHVLRRH